MKCLVRVGEYFLVSAGYISCSPDFFRHSRLILLVSACVILCKSLLILQPVSLPVFAMDRVCMIINFQGFDLGGVFFPREMAYAAGPLVGFFTIDLGELIRRPTGDDESQIKYCRQKLHGLPLYPRTGERALPHEELKFQVMQIYNSVKTDERNVVGYKGGVHEKFFLMDLQIPSVNIEMFGCPGIEKLRIKYGGEEDGSCGYHNVKFVPHRNRIACAMEKVKLCRSWWVDERDSLLKKRRDELERELRSIEAKMKSVSTW